MRALNIAATGMLAQQLNVEVISNNIANLNTTAFKRQRAEFQDLLYQDQRPVGAQSSDNGNLVPVGVQVGSGVKAAAVYRIAQQGTLLNTNNPLDLAIQGRGYFQVQMPDGTTAYTRSGSLQLSATGEIVTADGFIVDPGITLPNNTVAVTVNASGQVLAQIAGQTTPQTVGQFQLAAFFLDFAEQAGVLDRQHRLIGEGPQKVNRGLRERTRLSAPHHQQADGAVGAQ